MERQPENSHVPLHKNMVAKESPDCCEANKLKKELRCLDRVKHNSTFTLLLPVGKPTVQQH